MLSFHVSSPTTAGPTPAHFADRLVSRMSGELRRMVLALGYHRSETLPCFRGRNLLRDDLGLPPLDCDGLPL
jgi:hypothetical protein